MPSLFDAYYNQLSQQPSPQQPYIDPNNPANNWINDQNSQTGALPYPTQATPQGYGQQVGQLAGSATSGATVGALTGGSAPATPSIVGTTSNAMPPFSFGSTGGAPGFSMAGAAPVTPTLSETTVIPGSEALPAWSPTGSAAGAAPAATTGSGLLGLTGAPWYGAAAIPAGAATGAAQAMGVANAVQNKPLSVAEQAALALPTFGASFLVNPAQRLFGSSKGKEQLGRDAVRKRLQGIGFLDDKYQVELSNGEKFNMGKDGGEPWYNVDWSDPNVGKIVAAVQPLAAFFSDGDKKRTRDFAGYLTNAAISSGDPLKNVLNFYDKAKVGHDQIYGAIHLLSKSQGGPLDDAIADAYKNGLDQLYGVGAYEGKGQQFGTPPADLKTPEMPKDRLITGTKPQVTGSNPQQATAQQPTAKSSPFISSPNYSGGRQRLSPGIWKDEKGTYQSKTGTRGQ